jgi:hypothetical protein
MTTLRLTQGMDTDLGSNHALLPALRVGAYSVDGTGIGSPRLARRRLRQSRVRITDFGYRPFRVY